MFTLLALRDEGSREGPLSLRLCRHFFDSAPRSVSPDFIANYSSNTPTPHPPLAMNSDFKPTIGVKFTPCKKNAPATTVASAPFYTIPNSQLLLRLSTVSCQL